MAKYNIDNGTLVLARKKDKEKKEKEDKCKNYPKCKNILPLGEEGYCQDCCCNAFGVKI